MDESVEGASSSLELALLDFSEASERVNRAIEHLAGVGGGSGEVDAEESSFSVAVGEGIGRVDVGVVVQYVVVQSSESGLGV